jgi:hypothetical protein
MTALPLRDLRLRGIDDRRFNVPTCRPWQAE